MKRSAVIEALRQLMSGVGSPMASGDGMGGKGRTEVTLVVAKPKKAGEDEEAEEDDEDDEEWC